MPEFKVVFTGQLQTLSRPPDDHMESSKVSWTLCRPCAHACPHAQTQARTQSGTYTCTKAHRQYRHTRRQAGTHARAHTHRHAYVRARFRKRQRAHMNAHLHTHIQTGSHQRPRKLFYVTTMKESFVASLKHPFQPVLASFCLFLLNSFNRILPITPLPCKRSRLKFLLNH